MPITGHGQFPADSTHQARRQHVARTHTSATQRPAKPVEIQRSVAAVSAQRIASAAGWLPMPVSNTRTLLPPASPAYSGNGRLATWRNCPCRRHAANSACTANVTRIFIVPLRLPPCKPLRPAAQTACAWAPPVTGQPARSRWPHTKRTARSSAACHRPRSKPQLASRLPCVHEHAVPRHAHAFQRYARLPAQQDAKSPRPHSLPPAPPRAAAEFAAPADPKHRQAYQEPASARDSRRPEYTSPRRAPRSAASRCPAAASSTGTQFKSRFHVGRHAAIQKIDDRAAGRRRLGITRSHGRGRIHDHHRHPALAPRSGLPAPPATSSACSGRSSDPATDIVRSSGSVSPCGTATVATVLV